MSHTITKPALKVVTIVVATLLLLLTVAYLHKIVLLLFASILLAVLLDGGGQFIARFTPLSRRVGIGLFLLIITAIAVALSYWAVPRLSQQTATLEESMTSAFNTLEERLRSQPWGQRLIERETFTIDHLLTRNNSLFSQVSGIVSASVGMLTDFLVFVVMGMYLAFVPEPYVKGLAKLFPQHHRQDIRLLLKRMGQTLRLWFIGRFSSMLIVGIMSVIGLMLLGVPLALLLGLLTGLLAFVPIIGPTLALLPPMLIAFSESPQLSLWVFALYMGIQFVESYFLTPMIQHKAVEIPPIVLITSQLALGLLVGGLGILLAPPLAALVIVVVKMFYIERVLGDHAVSYAGEDNKASRQQRHPANAVGTQS